MRRVLLAIAVAVIVILGGAKTLLLSGFVDSRTWTASLVTRTVPAGTTERLGNFSFVNPDCSFGGYPDVRALSSPAHGTFAVQQGEDYTNYAANNQRYDCNKKKSRLTQVMYTPAAGYRGADEFAVLAIFPDGTTASWRFAITVE
jgi:hypothetical protein